MKALIRIDSAVDVRPVSPLFINDTLPSPERFKALARDNSYALNQLGLQSDAAENELRMSRTGYAPEIALFGKHTLYSHGIRKNLLPRTVVGAGFTWTLFDGLAREKKIAQAKIARQTLGLSSSQAEDDIDVGVDKLCAQISNALSSVAALGTTIDLSKELVRMRRKAFAEGMATSTEIVDAEVMLSKARIAVLRAYYEYDVALASLLSLCGAPERFERYSLCGRTESHIFGPDGLYGENGND